jgi:hypothetical protein
MYKAIYFDLDNTLVFDNLNGKSEICQSGFDKYMELKKLYPEIPFYLFTYRLQSDIRVPSVYHFDKVYGRDAMNNYINNAKQKFSLIKLLNPKYAFYYFQGLLLSKRNTNLKVLFLFYKHVIKDERILVIDDDKRVSRLFS